MPPRPQPQVTRASHATYVTQTPTSPKLMTLWADVPPMQHVPGWPVAMANVGALLAHAVQNSCELTIKASPVPPAGAPCHGIEIILHRHIGGVCRDGVHDGQRLSAMTRITGDAVGKDITQVTAAVGRALTALMQRVGVLGG